MAQTSNRREQCIAVLLLVASACSPSSPGAGNDPVVAAQVRSPASDAASPERRGGGPSDTTPKASDPSTGGGHGAGAAARPIGTSEPSREARRSELTDPGADVKGSGNPPGFVDIRGATIYGAEKEVRMTLSVDAEIPEHLGDDEYVIVEFRLMRKRDEVSVSATADRDGWTPALGGGPYRGSFEIRGSEIVFTVPWRAVGTRPFRYQASSSWTHSGLLATDYGFDSAPNRRSKRYPG